MKHSKTILKKSTRLWVKSQLLSLDHSNFDPGTTQEEEAYILNEVRKIAEKITIDRPVGSFQECIEFYNNETKN